MCAGVSHKPVFESVHTLCICGFLSDLFCPNQDYIEFNCYTEEEHTLFKTLLHPNSHAVCPPLTVTIKPHYPPIFTEYLPVTGLDVF